METISMTLDQRGQRYGDFERHALITQRLKDTMFAYASVPWPPYVEEAIDMIAHKLGRIVNGDPLYADSWHDIAGYATLVEQIIEKEVALSKHAST